MLKALSPTQNYTIREDAGGSGRFRAPRTKTLKDGTIFHYEHEGLDLVGQPGQGNVGPITGKGHWIWAYEKDSYSGLEITDGTLIVKVLYVLPPPQFKQRNGLVEAGKAIGVMQDISKKYPNVIPHIHLECRIHPSKMCSKMLKLFPRGIPINPEVLL